MDTESDSVFFNREGLAFTAEIPSARVRHQVHLSFRRPICFESCKRTRLVIFDSGLTDYLFYLFWVSEPSASSISAVTPATTGEDIDVPVMAVYLPVGRAGSGQTTSSP